MANKDRGTLKMETKFDQPFSLKSNLKEINESLENKIIKKIDKDKINQYKGNHFFKYKKDHY